MKLIIQLKNGNYMKKIKVSLGSGIIIVLLFSNAFANMDCNKSVLDHERNELSGHYKAQRHAGYISESDETELQEGLNDLKIIQGLACGWIKAIPVKRKNTCQERAENLARWNHQLAQSEITLADYHDLIGTQNDLQKMEGCKH